jgi:hypothetical protein
MRRAILLASIFLFFSAAAGAQGPAGMGSGGGRNSTGPGEYNPWEIAIGYQYNRDNLLGTPFNTNGVNISVARHLWWWFELEGQIGVGFGNTRNTTSPPNLTAKSIFGGLGPRLAYHNRSRFEPWAHVIVGVEHFRFTQTGFLSTNNALAGPGGGGVDVYLRPSIAFRVEADAVGSRFFSTNQRSFQATSGLVFNF